MSRTAPDAAGADEQRRAGLRIENVGEVESAVIAAERVAGRDKTEGAVVARHSTRTELHAESAGRNVGIRRVEIRGRIGVDGVVSPIAAEHVAPRQACGGLIGCRRAVVLGAAEQRR